MRSATIHGKLEDCGLCGTVYDTVALPELISVEARLSCLISWCGGAGPWSRRPGTKSSPAASCS